MGMFDDIKVHKKWLPIPDEDKANMGTAEEAWFQTKSFECMMTTIELTEQGELMRKNFDYEWDENAKGAWGSGSLVQRNINWENLSENKYSGIVNFYSNFKDFWYEFYAEFYEGVLIRISGIKYDDGIGYGRKYLAKYEKVFKRVYVTDVVQGDLMEKLACAQHDIWAHWMKYQFTCGEVKEDGSWVMPKEKVERWKCQMNTHYADLTESEKESDRHQVYKFWDYVADKELMDVVYAHRNLLALRWLTSKSFAMHNMVWKSKREASGEDCEEGWFIVGYDHGTLYGYITYHIPISLWNKANFPEIEKARWDGHTSEDVIKRLKEML